ncbi:MAG TPA: hypothetical protein VGK08_02830 [Thermoanaerobaculia bacterium]
MNTLLVFLLSLVAPAAPWGELSLTIERDHSSSSDHVTLCRVRVVNNGGRSWSGRAIEFEARAIRDGAVAATERGRFGLTLVPYGSLETLIGFTGRFDRFEVVPADRAPGERRSRGGKAAHGRRKTRGSRG